MSAVSPMTTVIRELSGLDEFRQAERLQYDVWGADEAADPADLMFVVQVEGGFVAGAFAGSRLLGYGFGLPTADPAIQHSHRLAVHPDARGQGLAARLKWFQYDWCADRGIELMRWTYDPARLPNASLNIATLGATASTYLPDYYGELAGIDAGAAADRLLAEWRVGSPYAEAARARRPGLSAGQLAEARRVEIPRDFAGLLRDDPSAAGAARMAVREALTAAFADGLAVVGFDRDSASYLLLPAAELG